MAISFVSAASAVGATVAMPAHQIGDLLLVFAFRGNSTPPTVPGGWSTLYSAGSAGTSTSHCLGGKFATSASEVTGTWTNAGAVVVHVYRGVGGSGASAGATGTAAYISYPALTLQTVDSTSWVARFGAHSYTAGGLGSTPGGYVSRTGFAGGGAPTIAGIDSNGGVTFCSQATQTVSSPSGSFRGHSLELKAATAPTTDTTRFFQFF